MLWETEVVREAGRTYVRAVVPRTTGDWRDVCRVLGRPCDDAGRELVKRIARAGLVRSEKPGAVARRSDGRASNVKRVFDMASVCEYKRGLSGGGD